MDRRIRLEGFTPDHITTSSTVVFGIITLYVIHQVLVYFDCPILSPPEIFWNALVYFTPARVLLDAEKRRELQSNNMFSQTHAAKSEALRRAFGVGTGAVTHKLSGGEGLMRRMSIFSADAPTTDAPPGLGNWDNSCYQNSVLQGLASVGALRKYLERPQMATEDGAASTSGALRETVAKLSDGSNNGKQLWTPAKLKSMSSWQQQDAQEYFSKIMDELDKEAAKAFPSEKAKSGLGAAVQAKGMAEQVKDALKEQQIERVAPNRNPMEGLLAQRVACTRCGFSEGLSIIPFNCLTVPLGSDNSYNLDDCLDEYTNLEEINDVECAKCTLLRAEQQLRQMVPASDVLGQEATPAVDTKILSLPPELRILASKRLHAIQQALSGDDFSDKTLNETCQIPKKARVSSTKTRQAVIGRAPQSLVVHVNRSVFDELTGAQRKNYANVRYPIVLDLRAWMLSSESTKGGASQSMLPSSSQQHQEDNCLYRLRAVVTHYGRHENGHYICYRRHPTREAAMNDEEAVDQESTPRERWWRLSDEDVSAVSEEDVLAQGGVFMLFYEREDGSQTTQSVVESIATAKDLPSASVAEADSVPVSTSIHPPEPEGIEAKTEPQAATPAEDGDQRPGSLPSHPPDDMPSIGTTTEDESEATDAEKPLPVKAAQKPPTQPFMRTSRGRQASAGENGFGSALRAVAAT